MLVLFDIDDTLLDDAAATLAAVDSLHEHLESGEAALEFRGRWFESLRHHFARYVAGQLDFQGQRRARIRDALRHNVSDADADALFLRYLTVYEQSWALFADVLPCLEALGAHRLGIVSNGNGQQQRRKLARLGILERFSWVVVSEDCGWAKPDARIFAHACELARARPADVMHVGDRHDLDALGAAGAGLRAVWLDRRRSKLAEPSRSDIVRVTTLAELPALVS